MAEKTEAPTPRKRDDARAKGQGIGRSPELSMGMTLGVGTLAMASLLPGIGQTLVDRMQASIINVDPHASNSHVIGEAGSAILTTVTLILPLACLVMVAGVAGNLVSGGLVFSPKAVRFNAAVLNPLTGMKRIVDKQALVRLGIAAAKLAILAVISWQVVGSRIPGIVATQGASAADIAAVCLSAVFQLGLTITILLAVVALVDFVVQRRKAQGQIKMTKEEVKQEYRESEGDPLVRGARKRRARQMAFARMMDAVPTADVVVTNPTTLAVALKYDSLTMRAPKLVAKGQRLMAERIKKLARDNNVPVIEDKPLARALFSRPIGAEVPTHLYRAVARLLVLVHQARFRGQARRGSGAADARSWTAAEARAAAGGLAARPWWAAASPGGVQSPDAAARGAAHGADASAAAALYGRDATHGEPPTWLDGDALGDSDVDEDALAIAMADDELADITPDEMSRFETGADDNAEDAAQAEEAAQADEELKR